MKNHFLPIFLLSFLISCSTTTKTNTAKTMDIYGPGVIHRPILADLEVSPIKIVGTATAAAGSSIDAVKQIAVSNALKTVRADVLVEPIFETLLEGKRITATVAGFPATYKGFRPVKQEDIEILKVGNLNTAKVYEPAAVSTKKRR